MKVIIIDKEQTLFSHTPSRNSKVTHSCIYCKQSPNKESLCIEAKNPLYSYLEKKSKPHNKCRKIIFDNKFAESSMLYELHKNGTINRVSVKFTLRINLESINDVAKAKSA